MASSFNILGEKTIIPRDMHFQRCINQKVDQVRNFSYFLHRSISIWKNCVALDVKLDFCTLQLHART